MAKSPDNGRPAHPDVLIPKQVAEEWGCSEQQVRNMVNRGQLGHFRLGGKLLRIRRAAVDEAERAMMAEPRPIPVKKKCPHFETSPLRSRRPRPVRVEVVPRRGLNRVEAGRYVGISAPMFDQLVLEGKMPQPFRIGSRTIWDLRKLVRPSTY